MAKILEKRHDIRFQGVGFDKAIPDLIYKISELYLSFKVPWIVGYSGGKDSTAVLQLIWMSAQKLGKDKLKYPIHVISTDTMVENPVVSLWVMESLNKMGQTAKKSGLPIYPHRLTPTVEDSFWVNLIGKGYPAPRPMFRWCTSRLKINPSNRFMEQLVSKHGEAILALGMRKAESNMRLKSMEKIEKRLGRVHEFLVPNANLPNSYVYTPIENWSDDDVWQYLLVNNNTPWGSDNNELLEFYKGATKDKECPMVHTTGTPSCGDSRFGCWVCTLVDKDRSMHAMIQNDQEKKWMQPLLKYRDSFNIKEDRERRDFRRIDGRVQLHNDRTIHGPYWQREREKLLERLLEVQEEVRRKKPKDVPDFDIITIEELQVIRKIWNEDKDEIEDNLPAIYESVTGKPFPIEDSDQISLFGKNEMEILRGICGEDDLHYQLVRGLISQEQKYRTMARRSGLFDALEKTIIKHFYTDEEDALQRAIIFKDKKQKIKDKPEQLMLAPFRQSLDSN